MAGGQRSTRASSRWLRAGVVAVGLGAAVTAGQGLATAEPSDSVDAGSVSSTRDTVSEAGNAAVADAPPSTADKPEAGVAVGGATGTTPKTLDSPLPDSDSSRQSTSTSMGDGPTSTLSAQQNSSHSDEPAADSDDQSPTTSTGQDEIAQLAASEDVEESAADPDAAIVEPDPAETVNASGVADEGQSAVDSGAGPRKGSTADSSPTLVSIPERTDGEPPALLARATAPHVAEVADDGIGADTAGAASTAQAQPILLNPIAPAPLDVPSNPVRTLVQSFLGLFGFNPYATGPSSNPFNPIFEAAWGFYRRIETSIAETAYTLFGYRFITTSAPAVDTGVDLLGETRQLNVLWTDGQGFTGYVLSDTIRGIAIYETASLRLIGGVYYPASPPGSAVALGPEGWDASAVSAYANMAVVYDYYANMLEQTSFNDHGAAIRITVVSNVLDNAYWYRTYQQFVFGHDFEAALDIIGHEYTHAVIDSVVAIKYPGRILGENNQSRALEEAYADIMGSLIEGKTDVGEWLVGEDYGCGNPSGCALRNLANPSEFDDPASYLDYDNNADEHYNSTIFSYAAYRMMSDPMADGVSRDTWAKVFYRSLYHLPAGASFAQARTAVIEAATEDVGLTTDQVQAIADAFDEVGIPSSATATRASVLV
jgi:Thermolysin metallopeptidase, alpha-helical domain/Thermolysin metallopeptidase, catalytic domain